MLQKKTHWLATCAGNWPSTFYIHIMRNNELLILHTTLYMSIWWLIFKFFYRIPVHIRLCINNFLLHVFYITIWQHIINRQHILCYIKTKFGQRHWVCIFLRAHSIFNMKWHDHYEDKVHTVSFNLWLFSTILKRPFKYLIQLFVSSFFMRAKSYLIYFPLIFTSCIR